jgi:ribosome-associated protein
MIGPHRDLGVGFGLVIPAAELSERVSRAGGPGGQRVNKVATKVSLGWNVARSEVLSPEQRARLLHKLGARLTARGELVVHAQSEREQGRNRADARRRLAALVNAALTPERTRHATRPGRSAVQRRLDTKRKRAQTKRGRGPVRGDD